MRPITTDVPHRHAPAARARVRASAFASLMIAVAAAPLSGCGSDDGSAGNDVGSGEPASSGESTVEPATVPDETFTGLPGAEVAADPSDYAIYSGRWISGCRFEPDSLDGEGTGDHVVRTLDVSPDELSIGFQDYLDAECTVPSDGSSGVSGSDPFERSIVTEEGLTAAVFLNGDKREIVVVEEDEDGGTSVSSASSVTDVTDIMHRDGDLLYLGDRASASSPFSAPTRLDFDRPFRHAGEARFD